MSNSARCSNAARQLGDLLAQLPVGDAAESWNDIETTARSLADGLRVKDGMYCLGFLLSRVILTTLFLKTIITPLSDRHFSPRRLPHYLKMHWLVHLFPAPHTRLPFLKFFASAPTSAWIMASHTVHFHPATT